MAIETADAPIAEPVDATGMLGFYEKAKRAEWQIDDLPWQEIPLVPEKAGSAEKQRTRLDLWRSVVGQQLQADERAVEMGTQLLRAAPDPAAKQYYTTLVNDEARHTEAWLKLTGEIGPASARDPYLHELTRMVLEADQLEQKVFMMQVFFERAIISRFQQIIDASGGTVLAALCEKLKIDDGIHHGSGLAYERFLLESAGKQRKQQVAHVAAQAFPVYIKHSLWRPPERDNRVGKMMISNDLGRIAAEATRGKRDAEKLGIDMSGISITEVIERETRLAA